MWSRKDQNMCIKLLRMTNFEYQTTNEAQNSNTKKVYVHDSFHVSAKSLIIEAQLTVNSGNYRR